MSITCPVTGKQLTRRDLTIVSNKPVNDQISKDERLFGSKIVKIIELIKSFEPLDKVIVFAHWDKLLHTIGYAMELNDIHNVYIKGNITIRDKSINEFRNNPSIKAILLSADFGASGVNLFEATKVIIVHPFLGETGHHYELQAI